jgi:hypothetical protein
VYQGDNLAAGSVRPSHGSLQEKLLVLGFEVLQWLSIRILFRTDLNLYIPNSGSMLLLIWRPPCAELNVLPWMITFENSKWAISTGNVGKWGGGWEFEKDVRLNNQLRSSCFDGLTAHTWSSSCSRLKSLIIIKFVSLLLILIDDLLLVLLNAASRIEKKTHE